MKFMKRVIFILFLMPFMVFIFVLFIFDVFIWVITGKTGLIERINKWLDRIVLYVEEEL